MMMADLGAEVVKIEDTVQGDYLRWMPPYADGAGTKYAALNRNKKSASINLKDPRGRDLFLKLTEIYDVVVDGFRPGVLDKLGVGYEAAAALNPKIIYCSLTGYGGTGPYANRAGHDINYIGYAGVLGLTGPRGGKPVPPGIQAGDIGGALNALIGILAALHERSRSGRGQRVDVSLADSAFAMLAMVVADQQGGEPQTRGETRLAGGAPCYNTYEASDSEYICIGAIEPKFFKEFCRLAGREDLEVYHFGAGKDRDHLEKELTALFKSRTRAEWLELLERADVCVGPVNTVEQALRDPQLLAREMLVEVPTGKGGSLRATGLPFKLSRTPGIARPAPAPAHGGDTAAVLAEIGVDDQQLNDLLQSGTVK
jgi:crotonobetainyl-CoA:carnitine CoA-transferase CaiB-like acyl-CoA transferase